jgi:hypothetical protein
MAAVRLALPFALILALCLPAEAAELRHEVHEEFLGSTPRLRLHVLTEDGRLTAFFGVTDHEPTVRKEGPAYVLTFLLPDSGPSAPIPWPSGPAKPLLSVSDALAASMASNEAGRLVTVRILTDTAPTVSKRGQEWFFLSLSRL